MEFMMFDERPSRIESVEKKGGSDSPKVWQWHHRVSRIIASDLPFIRDIQKMLKPEGNLLQKSGFRTRMVDYYRFLYDL
jgi:hypothetical protein